MIGQAYHYGRSIHTIQRYTVSDERGRVYIYTDKNVFDRDFESCLEFLDNLDPVNGSTENQGQVLGEPIGNAPTWAKPPIEKRPIGRPPGSKTKAHSTKATLDEIRKSDKTRGPYKKNRELREGNGLADEILPPAISVGLKDMTHIPDTQDPEQPVTFDDLKHFQESTTSEPEQQQNQELPAERTWTGDDLNKAYSDGVTNGYAQGKEDANQVMILPQPEINSTVIAKCKDYLIDSIAKLQNDPVYIPQAEAIKHNVDSIIDLARIEVAQLDLIYRINRSKNPTTN